MVSPDENWPLSARRCNTGFQAAPDRKLEGVTFRVANLRDAIMFAQPGVRYICDNGSEINFGTVLVKPKAR